MSTAYVVATVLGAAMAGFSAGSIFLSGSSAGADLIAMAALTPVFEELPWAQHSFDLFHWVRYEAVVDTVGDLHRRIPSRRSQGPTERSSPDQRGDVGQERR